MSFLSASHKHGAYPPVTLSQVARINAHPAVYTTSSCSGRISVFGEPGPQDRAAGRKGGEWVYATHERASAEVGTEGWKGGWTINLST